MDEFDTKLKEAQPHQEVREDFVETTMQHIRTTQPRKKWGMKIWIPSTVVGAAIVVAALLFLPLFHGTQTPTANTSSSQSAQPAGQTASLQTSVTPAADTDDASLQSDLDVINNGMNQENNDQNSADSSLNDSSQQIVVPSS